MTSLALITPQISAWLKSLKSAEISGGFNLCQTGNLFAPTITQGLGFSSLASKIAYTINDLDHYSTLEKNDWIKYIREFQNNENTEGLFEDDGLLADLDGLKIRNFIIQGPFKFIKNKSVRIAETRQALAALMSLGARSDKPIKCLPTTPEFAIKSFYDLNWSNPWHAGSQLGHLLFFIKYNQDHFGIMDNQNLAKTFWLELEKIQSKENGAWYLGRPKSHILVNGAMKVLIAYNLYLKEISYPEKLIDLALDSLSKADGCHLLDQIYVLHSCQKQTKYRTQEIKDFSAKLQNKMMEHFQKDGGFSFYPLKSQTSYYGKKVSLGHRVGDIHGTHLFTWSLVLIDDILNDFKGSLWKHPIT